ncbi:anti-sigma factor RsbA family regulatory protein [Actinoplanes sp. GCM10030250]|uniref:anti-sigma factor RsbA family regulatory protein n=1 Tax=Actinoplanes sp. GCM10030250 TaxID=3273376 RepID=UPI003615FF5B
MSPLPGGHRHDAVCHDSAEHLLGVAVPFLRGGITVGEPAVVTLGGCTTSLIRAALPPGGGVTFLDADTVYTRPAALIRQYRDLIGGHLADGAPRVRILGEPPREVFGPAWDWWARYESAVNHVYDEFPVWSLCVYDTRVTPDRVLTDVRRTHPHSFLPGGRYAVNRDYTDPAGYLGEPRPVRPDPLQATAPVADLIDPSGAVARDAVRGLVTGPALDGMLLGITEAVTNAHRHGKGAVRLRAWQGGGRVVVTVTDEGPGPGDPFAGLVQAAGNGLWLSHLFCDHVALERDADGFTVRLTAGSQAADTGTRTTASKT